MEKTLKGIWAAILAAAANALVPIVSGKTLGADYNLRTLAIVSGSAAITAVVAYFAKSPLTLEKKPEVTTAGVNPNFPFDK